MKREMELVREILLRLEKSDQGVDSAEIVVAEFGPSQIGHHCKWMLQAGLVEGLDGRTMGDVFPVYLSLELTWDGHEFLETIRDPQRWEKTKQVLRKSGSWATDLLTEVARRLALQAAEQFLR